MSLRCLFAVSLLWMSAAVGTAGLAGAQVAPAASDTPRLRLDVDVTGVGGELEDNVLALLGIREVRKDKNLTELRIQQLHDQAPGDIEEALQPFGFYRPVIRSDLRQEGNAYRASYAIDPGPVMRLEEVRVEVTGPGADDPGFRNLVESFPLSRGDVLDHPTYAAGKQAFLDHAAQNGYLDALFETAEMRVDVETYSAAIALHYVTGPRYLFGPISLNQTVLEPEFLQGYVTAEPGEPLNTDELLVMQSTLADSPYFERVEVETRPEDAVDLHVPVDFNLIPARRQKWDLGAGYGTDTGPRGSVKLEFRRINRQGHRGELDLRVSDIESYFASRYHIPGAYPRTDVLTFSLGYADLDPRTSESQTAIAAATLTRSRGRWRETYALSYQRERFTVGLDSGTSYLLIPETSWSRVKADDRLYPLRGKQLELKLRAADESLLSDQSFVQLEGKSKYIRGLAGDRLRFLARLNAGYTFTSDFRELPPSIRFFAGGDHSVRGFDYRSLGRLDEAGNVIGGEALLTGTLEVDSLFYERWGRWGLAAFYDFGNALESFSDTLKHGTGVGIRWLSPIGLVRADVAWATSEPDDPIRFHLTIGPDL